MTCLNPVYTIGDQLMEALRCHDKSISKQEAKKRAIEMLELVGINNADKRVDQYPHEFSGGMRQRAMIAMAMICHPRLLIADEPTTALDVTIQAQILDLLKKLNREGGMSMLFISPQSERGCASCVPRVAVMQRGVLVEEGDINQVFYHPQHDYTKRLIAAIPTRHRKEDTP